MPGDSISLAGTFTDTLWIDMGVFYGTVGYPIFINSTNPNNRAVIRPADGHGISIYDSPKAPAGGFEMKISDVNIEGHGGLASSGECDDAAG